MLHLFPKHLALSIDNGDELLPLLAGKHAVDVLVDSIKYLLDPFQVCSHGPIGHRIQSL